MQLLVQRTGLRAATSRRIRKRKPAFARELHRPARICPREQILIIYPDGWFQYLLDHRSPEIENPIFIPAEVGRQLEWLFPECTPRKGRWLSGASAANPKPKGKLPP